MKLLGWTALIVAAVLVSLADADISQATVKQHQANKAAERKAAERRRKRRKSKQKEETDPGMRIAKRLDTTKDGFIDKIELRNAPQEITLQLCLEGFKLVAKLKTMNPKNKNQATLAQAAVFFNQAAAACAAGVPLEDAEQKKKEEADDEFYDEHEDIKPEDKHIAVLADRNKDGIVSFKEFMQVTKEKMGVTLEKGTPEGVYGMMDSNRDGEVTIHEFIAFARQSSQSVDQAESNKAHTEL